MLKLVKNPKNLKSVTLAVTASQDGVSWTKDCEFLLTIMLLFQEEEDLTLPPVLYFFT